MLKVENKTIIKKVLFARTTLERTKGLMFEDKKKFDYALVFEFPVESKVRSSLHMIFVFFPIDVLFLNKNKVVVDKTTLNPFTPNYTPKKASKYVIEMPKGKARGIKLGQKVDWS
ncbi:MAG: DUF192 domain-containing protein [Candidatus ainarchaeum sp.]|nr:DUF192 domain-containing protein [Candidatus ainarchaeum sp.]MDD3085806.1 DUF192 domain-containing protein [Candidatus ainarchaeum sp.]MDD4128454.1 DUF192 domain-containing protein [Candidatus ainarchaeum sp.]MDD4467952.1 DUF192 domain-containing protein [Candidatus ainarchaeum sp.]HPM86176.1 DUF192 domain-containing protein [archaeon]